jgi:hypothetical protein
MKNVLKYSLLASLTAYVGVVSAKLPAPSDEAKAKAVEAAAKSAWDGQVANYKLCLAQDRTAAYYKKTKLNANPKVKPAPSTCVNPGPFVFPPTDKKT